MPPKNQEKVKIAWSPNFAYAIGLITSDGCLAADERHIRFVSKDLELIEKFKTAFQITNKIRKRTSQNNTRYWFVVEFGDKIFYQFLLSIGLMPNKSKVLGSINVPDKYFSDFVRGVFDGDGTFYSFYDKRWPNSFCYKLSFASASRQFILWFKDTLSRLYGTKGFLHKGAGVINLEYVKGDSKKIFRAMYYKDCDLFLTRKYHKIKDAFKKDQQIKLKRAAVAQW